MAGDYQLKERLVKLASKIQDARVRGWNETDCVMEFEHLLPGTPIDSMCNSDLDAETIVDVCLGINDAKRSLSRDELLALIRRFFEPGPNYFATEAESILAVEAFKHNCRHSAGSDLIFYPQEYFGGRSNPTPEEIVDKALNGLS